MKTCHINVPVVDLHMHLIPGVDDGSKDMNMSMEMLQMSYDQGVRVIFCTTHDTGYDPATRTGYPKEQYAKLKELATEKFPDIQLYLGCEVYCIPFFMDEIIDRLYAEEYPTMNGTNYVLIEFPTWGITVDEIKYCVQRLNEARFHVIIAHAERYPGVINGMETIRELKAMNCLIQVNAYSFEEERNPQIRGLACSMLEEKIVDFIGSDAHRTTHRPPEVEEGVVALYRRCEKEYADAICFRNAMELLCREDIEEA